MPRPRVPIQNRKRALQACLQCRNSKKRCNGRQPCANCVRKNLTTACIFEDIPHHSASTQPVSSTPGQSSDPSGGIDLSPDAACSTRSPVDRLRGLGTTRSTETSITSPEASHMTQPRLLDNSRGEKVFFGGSASLAFLQLIRDTVSQSLGRSDFTHHTGQDHMLEEPQTPAPSITEIQLDTSQECAFLDAYFIATQGLVEVCPIDHVHEILRRHRATPSESLKPFELAMAHTSCAIGAQCSSRTHTNISASRAYFADAQREAFEGMIENPSLEMVQLFLLLAFYMLGACHRNAAFMYIGVAARAAYVLGLHSPDSDKAVPGEVVRNRATWQCLVSLDTMVSSLLGRPSATMSTHSIRTPDMAGAKTHGMSSAMQANFQLACLLDQKVQELYNSDKVTVDGARKCLDQLTAWSSRLPSELRFASNSIQNANAKGQVTGGLHVSSFYYFAVMLVSRPFLIVHLTSRLAKGRHGSDAISMDSPALNAEADIQEIANACLNAASYMIQTCVETQSHSLLPGNMRVLKAWVFAAGLVLGFEMFTTNRSEFEIEESFHGSREILKIFSSHSAQASHYYDILTSLSDSIAARRRQVTAHRRRTDRPIVERIMAFKSPPDPTDTVLATNKIELDAAQVMSTSESENQSASWIPSFAADLNFQEMLHDPFMNWENADFLSWDPFSSDFTGQQTVV